MTEEERMTEALDYEETLRKEMDGLLENVDGILAIRTFAMVKHSDGSRSVIALGKHMEGQHDDASFLDGIIQTARDINWNHSHWKKAQPRH